MAVTECKRLTRRWKIHNSFKILMFRIEGISSALTFPLLSSVSFASVLLLSALGVHSSYDLLRWILRGKTPHQCSLEIYFDMLKSSKNLRSKSDPRDKTYVLGEHVKNLGNISQITNIPSSSFPLKRWCVAICHWAAPTLRGFHVKDPSLGLVAFKRQPFETHCNSTQPSYIYYIMTTTEYITMNILYTTESRNNELQYDSECTSRTVLKTVAFRLSLQT